MQARRRHMEAQANIRSNERRAKKMANLFENRFRSGREENERQMENNVMRGIRVCDGYLVCLDLA